MRHHRKLSDDERRQVIEARANGTPARALAHRFSVSPRTIYNTLSRAEGPRSARTKTVSARLSERELTGFMEALAARGTADRPSVLRRLMGAADRILTSADQATIDKLQGWNADIQTRGAAINQIARKLNEAKLQCRPMPYSAEDDATIRAMAMFLFAFVEEFQTLWAARRAAIKQEVDKALAGLAAKGPDP
jgi:transposase-like protein